MEYFITIYEMAKYEICVTSYNNDNNSYYYLSLTFKT